MRYDNGPYSVKGVKSFIGLEGHGYNAKLLKNGKEIAFAIDSADGGDVNVQFDDAAEEREFYEFVDKLPASEYMGTTLRASVGMFVEELVNEYEVDRRMKRVCGTHVAFTLVDDDPNSYRSIKATPATKAGIIAHVKAKFGDKIAVLWNEKYGR